MKGNIFIVASHFSVIPFLKSRLVSVVSESLEDAQVQEEKAAAPHDFKMSSFELRHEDMT